MSQEASRNSFKKPADGKGHHLVPERAYPHRLRGDLVLPDGLHGPPEGTVREAPDEEEGEGHEPVAPPEIGMRGQPLQAKGAVGHALEIVGNHAHDLSESQGDNGQVVSADSKDGKPHEKCQKGGDHAGGEKREPEGDGNDAERPDQGFDDKRHLFLGRTHGQQCRGVRTDGDKGIGLQGELPADPVDQIVAHGQGDEDGAIVQETDLVFRRISFRPVEKDEKADESDSGQYPVTCLVHNKNETGFQDSRSSSGKNK